MQSGLVVDGVVAAEQKVDSVGAFRSQGLCELCADEGGGGCWVELNVVAHTVKLDVCLDVFGELDCRRWVSLEEGEIGSRWMDVLVSPASPVSPIRMCLLSGRVLSSDAFKMVAPRMAALEAAMMVKSLPVIPKSTSLPFHQY